MKRRTTVIGKNLYLVEGAFRWGLYDLEKEIAIVIDRQSGELLNEIANIEVSGDQKRRFLQQYASAVWDESRALKITKRLFEAEIIPAPEKIPMDLLWLEITDDCNEKCIHCYVGSERTLERKRFMPLGLAKKIIRQGRKTEFRKLQFTGGEPLLHPHFFEMVAFAREINYPEIEVYTNLTIVTESELKRLKTLDVMIATSLLGPSATIHDVCTRTPGSFSRWYNNMKRLRSLGVPYRIGVVRMRQNEETMSEIEKFLRKEGFLAVNEPFKPDDIRLTANMTNNADLSPLGTFSNDNNPWLTVNPTFFHRARHYNPCWRGELAVATDGNVYPCVFSRKLVIGNLGNETLSNVLKRLREKYWVITLDRVEKCRDCELRYACMDCRALSFNTSGDLYGPPTRCNYNPYH
ncbi:MAG: radical SAM protein [Candidatus Berkelbacteria bacterium Licking1014_2]|uniref:Radical SAM protein n=1 Tax=Candidatus Berkelbacteria bacterium Licking1014_2 TaxID=2017146 RepID=A0A554LV76_9BACT|nr:MAG: radical SAM protein [Candidatus Berkelbacteria bacterium Licking1014_2]